MKGDIVKLTGLLKQILRSRPKEGTSTQPVVTAQPVPKQAVPFTFILQSLEAINTSLEAQFTTSFSFSQSAPIVDLNVETHMAKVIKKKNKDFDKLSFILIGEIKGN